MRDFGISINSMWTPKYADTAYFACPENDGFIELASHFLSYLMHFCLQLSIVQVAYTYLDFRNQSNPEELSKKLMSQEQSSSW